MKRTASNNNRTWKDSLNHLSVFEGVGENNKKDFNNLVYYYSRSNPEKKKEIFDSIDRIYGKRIVEATALKQLLKQYKEE